MFESAKFYKIGLSLGLLNTSDVQMWVNEQIIRGTEPENLFIELAYLKENELLNTIHLLNEFDDHTDDFHVIRTLFNTLDVKVLNDIQFCRRLAECLYSFAIEHNYEVPDDFNEILFFDDSYDLAMDKVYGTPESWHSEFIEFVGSFNKAC